MPQSTLEFVMLDKESNANTLWQQEEFVEICSIERLTEEAVNFERKIPIRNSQEARHNQDPERFFAERFWNRRPDRVVIDKANHKVSKVYIRIQTISR